ncbi:MAG: serine hydrolase [Chlorobi bacterium]|nr:serine hydrolase [Chlorobiota bacterium]
MVRKSKTKRLLFASVGIISITFALLLYLYPFLIEVIIHNLPNLYDHTIFPLRQISPAPNSERILFTSNEPITPKVVETTKLKEYNDDYKTTALILLYDTTVLFEKYYNIGHIDSPSNSFSVAKTVVALLASIAVHNGIISWNDTLGKYLPWLQNPEMKKIKLRHLVTMTSGTNWFEHYWFPITHTSEAYYGNNLPKLMNKLKVADTPGTRFKYKSGDTQLLGFALSSATKSNLSTLLEKWIWHPAKIPHVAYWALDRPNGMEKAFCCIFTPARAYTILGYLMLNKGIIHNDTIFPPHIIDSMTQPVNVPDQDNKPTTYYGKGVWLLDSAGYKNIFYARGIKGQFIIIIPHEKIVIVRLGRWRMNRIGPHNKDVFLLIDWAREQIKNVQSTQ